MTKPTALPVRLVQGIKHPEKVQAIANVMCHTAFGYHRIALINNSLILLDHNLEHESDWQELGGKPSRCFITQRCFKTRKLTGVPKANEAPLLVCPCEPPCWALLWAAINVAGEHNVSLLA